MKKNKKIIIIIVAILVAFLLTKTVHKLLRELALV